jgi:hypothetical protein
MHPVGLNREFQQVSVATRELAQASRQLLIALIKNILQIRRHNPAKSARHEADKLRAYADNLYRADPRYAQDLYAAATRHELTAGVQ